MPPEQQDDLEPAAPAEPTGQQTEATESTEGAVSSSSLLETLRGSLAAGDEGEDGDAAPAAKEGDTTATTGERLRGPDGRFIAKDGTPTDDPAQAQLVDPAKPAQPEAKPADDPYREPEGLKPEAKERFRSLVTMAKESKQQLEAAQAQVGEMQQTVTAFQQMIVESGATDQEFLALLDFARAVKSGNWQAAEPLLAHLTQQYRVATGRDPNGADPFAQHQDLAQAVQEGKITPEYARQVLQSRQVLAQQQQQAQAAQQQQVTQQQYVQAVQSSAQTVRSMVQHWSQTDLDWPKKQAIMQEHAKRIGETMPPEHWQAALQLAYDMIGQTMTTMTTPRPQPAPGDPQPLRPAAANAGRREPASLQEAIAGAVGAA